MTHKQSKGIIPIFIKAVVFQHVGINWLIKSNYQSVYYCDKELLIGLNMVLVNLQKPVQV